MPDGCISYDGRARNPCACHRPLATWSQRALPGLPHWVVWPYLALIYVGFNAGHDETLSGWAIPAATDIALRSALALLAGRVPVSLKIFGRRWLFPG
jgi:Na+/H+ antiporter NhaA